MNLVMKKSILLLAGLFTVFVSFSQDTRQTVTITNIENVKGDLYIGWYNQSSAFRINEKAVYRKKVTVAHQKQVSVDFTNIPKGKYAIAVFLDENDNYTLDKNIFGIPKEKYGFSNNVLPALRPSTFEESAFEVNHQNLIINIKLK